MTNKEYAEKAKEKRTQLMKDVLVNAMKKIEALPDKELVDAVKIHAKFNIKLY